jgi:Predicted metal-dependent hydrolase with the TIM-barrel fold
VQSKTASWPGPHDEIRDGVRRMSRSMFAAVAEEAARRGFRLSTKAGGEPMVDWVLDVYGDVDARYGIRDRRWVMIHSQFTHERQMARLHELGVAVATAANFIWNHGAAYVAGYGHDVADRSVPFRSFLDAGVPVANESDTTPKNPMFALWLMTTRTDGVTGQCLGPGQRITREQALRVLTNNGAYLLQMEDRIGSIEVGKYADLVVLADDVLTVDDEQIKDLKVDATMVGGKFVYTRTPGALSTRRRSATMTGQR